MQQGHLSKCLPSKEDHDFLQFPVLQLIIGLVDVHTDLAFEDYVELTGLVALVALLNDHCFGLAPFQSHVLAYVGEVFSMGVLLQKLHILNKCCELLTVLA